MPAIKRTFLELSISGNAEKKYEKLSKQNKKFESRLKKTDKVFKKSDQKLKVRNKLFLKNKKSIEQVEKRYKRLGQIIKRTDVGSERFKNVQKEIKKTKRQLTSYQSKLRKSGGSVGGGVGGGGAGGGGGGVFSKGLGKAGGVAALAVAAVSTVESVYTAGESAANAFVASLGVAGTALRRKAELEKQFGKGFVKFKDDFFDNRSVQSGATALADIGVDKGQISENIELLSKYFKAQGANSFSGGVSQLAGGDIKSGRGLDADLIEQMKALAEGLGNSAQSKFAFAEMIKILKAQESNFDVFAEIEKKRVGRVKDAENKAVSFKESNAKKDFYLKGLSAIKTFEILNKGADLNRKTNQAGVKAEQVIGSTVKTVKEIYKKTSDAVSSGTDAVKDLFGIGTNADGGTIRAGETSLVGERGAELITSQGNSNVINNKELMSMGGRDSGKGSNYTTNNFSFNITGDDSRDVADEVEKVLNNLSRTTFPYQAGLTPNR